MTRFLPFICLDPGEKVPEQLDFAAALMESYRIYGIKFNSANRGVPIRLLSEKPGSAILEFAQKHDLPLIFHAAVTGYAASGDILEMAEAWPRIRFCLAHALIFCRELLDRAASMRNVWVNTAALKIQMELASDLIKTGRNDAKRMLDIDWTSPADGIKKLLTAYPDMMIWGSDSLSISYTPEKQSEPICGIQLQGHL